MIPVVGHYSAMFDTSRPTKINERDDYMLIIYDYMLSSNVKFH